MFTDVIQAVVFVVFLGIVLADPKLQALAEFTRIVFASRGLLDRQQTDAFLSAGYGERQILEIVLQVDNDTAR